MTLAAGKSLTHYEILAREGAGGMGEVYRARDTRLDREVAIKVLPEELADDQERLIRFEREAKTLASLNHPNVAQIYGIDQVEDTCFLALELVPGEDLGERLSRGPLPLDEALDVMRQIADGLEAAHESGVIHRDLKPANVRVTPEGTAKVLDFGLAKPMGPRGSKEGTTTAESDSFLMTEEGLVLGTPTYMSPEQARGKPVDRRTDVWAFGCVFFECLSGKRAFGGESVTDVLAAIVHREPDWSALPAATPPAVVGLVRRCLVKDPRKRLRDVGEARVLLEDPGAGDAAPAGTRSASPLSWLVVAALAVALGAVWFLRAPSPARDELRLAVHLPFAEELETKDYPNLALSRDGKRLAWVGGVENRLFVRDLDSYETRALEGTAGAGIPTFSPDGEWVAYYVEDELFKAPVSGGPPTLVMDEDDHVLEIDTYTTPPRGAAWGDDGRIAFVPSTVSGVFAVPDAGGDIEEVTAVDNERDERTHRWPQVLPGARAILYTVDDNPSPEYYDDARIVAHPLDGGEARVLVDAASQARYAAGLLVFARGGALYAQRFDPDALETRGSALQVLLDVATDGSSGAVQFALADDGTLAYAPGGTRDKLLRIAWHDLETGAEPLELPTGAYFEPRLSPDGRKVAYALASSSSTDIWIHDLERGTTSRATSSGSTMAPIWSRDGTHIAFHSVLPRGIYLQRVGSPNAPELLIETESRFGIPSYFDEDMKTLVISADRGDTRTDVLRLDLATREVTEILAGPANEIQPALSPDGRWLAYTSDETGQSEVFLAPEGDTSVRWQVSSDGGIDSRWSPDGKTLYYLRDAEEELWAVDLEVDAGTEPQLGAPRLVAESFFYFQDYRYNYDVAPDGRFVTIVAGDVESEPGREIRILPGWAEGVKERLRARE